MSIMSNNSSIFAFLAGAAAGAAVTYFLTSEKTAQTREKLAKGAEEVYEKAKKTAVETGEKVKDTASRMTSQAKTAAQKKFAPIREKVIEGLDAAETALENM